jgi:hypothetical protein
MDPKIEALLQAWDEGAWEFTLVFEGLSDDDLWKRAHPSLLSVGELAAHVGYGEAQMLSADAIESPFFDKRFDYYPRQVDAPVKLDLSVEQVLGELKKIHGAVKTELANVQDFDAKVHWRDDWTWIAFIRYQVFHVAYHCGQAYSVRHLMGHQTTDN